MIRIALVGTSGYGETYLKVARQLALRGKVSIAAATIVNRAGEKENWDALSAAGTRCFESTASMWEAMAGQIDLCMLPTAPHTHVPLAVEALFYGSNVLVEKPLCPTLEGVRRIRAALAGAGTQLFVGYQDLYVKENHLLKQRLLRGDFGPLKRITFRGLWPRRDSYYARNEWGGRRYLRGEAVHDSPISNAFAHFLNLALFWAGPSPMESAQAVNIDAELLRAKPIETFDTCALRITTSTGVQILFLATHSCPHARVPELILETEAGPIHWFHEHQILLPGTGGASREVLPLPGTFETRLAMLEAILDALTSQPAFTCRLAMAESPIRVTSELQSLPVEEVPIEQIELLGSPEDDPLRSIAGIEDTFDACLKQNRLPAELPPQDGEHIFSENLPAKNYH